MRDDIIKVGSTMNTKFDFTNLFVLDLANNHQGFG